MTSGEKTLGVGILGFGYMGRMQSYCYEAIPWYYDPPPVRTRLVAVATSRPETARAAGAHGFDFAAHDWREVVSRDDVDVVNICTPNSLHAEQVEAALRAGKHVYCDKPPADTLEGAGRIRDAARVAADESGAKFMLVFQNRFLPATIRAKELVDEGFLGRVLAFRAVYPHSGYVDPARPISWRMKKDVSGGGALHDLGSHVVDMMLHLAGPFAAVNATLETFVKERPTADGGVATVDVDDAAYLTIRLRGGGMGTIEATRVATGANDEFTFEIHGERGAIRFSLMDPNWLEAFDATVPRAPYGGRRGYTKIECIQRYPGASLPSAGVAIGWQRGHIESLAEFLRAIAEDRAPSPSADEAYEVQRVLDAAERSSDEGRWVSI